MNADRELTISVEKIQEMAALCDTAEEVLRAGFPEAFEDEVPRCPHCGEELDYITYRCDATEYGSINFYDRGDGSWDGEHESDNWETWGEYEYECPECGAALYYGDIEDMGVSI